jgi:hypothetical protein
MIFHVTARAVGRLAPFLSHEAAAFAWGRLRLAFPDAVAAILMPNHLHQMVGSDSADTLRRRVAALLSGLTRSGLCGPERLVWQTVPAPKPIEDVRKLRRDVRYVALNPCRARLCADPLEWTWSTHRDVMGAVADPWVTAERLAAALQIAPRGFAAKHHAYVSGDPAVRVDGTPPPIAAPRRQSALVPLEAVAAAAAAALRLPPAAVTTRAEARRLFVQLAQHQGWRDARMLARRCGLQPWQVFHLLRQPAPGLDAARLCLGDRRLTCALPASAADRLSEPMPPRITAAV